MIVVPAEALTDLDHRQTPTCLRFRHCDGDDVYTAMGVRNGVETVPGSVVMDACECMDVKSIGSPDDHVRVIVPPSLPVSISEAPVPKEALEAATEDASVPAQISAVGYVKRHNRWHKVPVEIVPLQEQLYSRTRGLFETDVLAGTRIFVAGLGSGGSPIAWELAKLGVGRMTLMDHDRVEVANVVRHMAGLSDVGRLKTNVMADMIRDKNPYADLTCLAEKITWDSKDVVRDAVRESDLVISGVDDHDARVILNRICVQNDKPLIIGGAFRRAYGGQVLVVRPGKTPCYQCFLEAMPEKARDREIAGSQQAQRYAYSDRPVAIEPGLSTDIAPISLMMVKLAIQQLLHGTQTTLASLNEDLVAPWYLWINRREIGTDYANLEPLEFGVDGLRVLRWYGVDFERNPACPCCGDFVEQLAGQDGIHVNEDQIAAFAADGTN